MLKVKTMRSVLLLLLALLIAPSCALAPKVKGLTADSDEPFCHEGAASTIVNGRPVKIDEALSKDAVLLITERNGKTSFCTGVPISSRTILTAAHCVNKAEPSAIQVIFHIDSKCELGGLQEKIIRSVSYTVHEDFDGSPRSHADLAMVRLSKGIPGEYPVATFYDGSAKLSSDDVQMLGYGITDESKQDGLVLRTTSKSFKADTYLKGPMLLFNQKNETGGFCRGDSGAPVYVFVGGVKKVIGINSMNIGLEKNRECHTVSVAMYVPHFSGWIKTQLLKM